MRLICFNTGFIERYLPPIPLPLPKGPLKGRKWLPSGGFKFFSGNFEPLKTRAIQSLVHEGDVVYDIGAHVGYYTVMMSELAGPTGRVIAFEPNQFNFRHLERHIILNKCDNVRAFPVCVSNTMGTCKFKTRCASVEGHMAEDGDMAVDSVRLDTIVEDGTMPTPTFMKVDVEGAELSLLHGAKSLVSTCRPVILLAVHSGELYDGCKEFLTGLGYRLDAVTPFDGDMEVLAAPAQSPVI